MFETDYKSNVDIFQGGLSSNTEVGSTLDDCRTLLSNNPSYHVSFIKRQANWPLILLLEL